jgi:hypothetical protein
MQKLGLSGEEPILELASLFHEITIELVNPVESVNEPLGKLVLLKSPSSMTKEN